MKILQIVQKPQRRGAEVFAFQLSRQLDREGYEVRIVYLYPYSNAGALPLQPHDYILPGQESHFLEKFPGVNPHLLCQLQRIIDEFQPNVVQVNGARTVKYGAFARYLDSKKKKKKMGIDLPQYRPTTRVGTGLAADAVL